MKRLRIYVAGPITSDDDEIVKQNIAKARNVGVEILKKGHFPYVPHTHFDHWDLDLHEYYAAFQKHGEDMLNMWADALFFIDSSNGADHEKKLAEQLGLQILTSLDEVKPAEEDSIELAA